MKAEGGKRKVQGRCVPEEQRKKQKTKFVLKCEVEFRLQRGVGSGGELMRHCSGEGGGRSEKLAR